VKTETATSHATTRTATGAIVTSATAVSIAIGISARPPRQAAGPARGISAKMDGTSEDRRVRLASAARTCSNAN
jgi:hypothetical protein